MICALFFSESICHVKILLGRSRYTNCIMQSVLYLARYLIFPNNFLKKNNSKIAKKNNRQSGWHIRFRHAQVLYFLINRHGNTNSDAYNIRTILIVNYNKQLNVVQNRFSSTILSFKFEIKQ